MISQLHFHEACPLYDASFCEQNVMDDQEAIEGNHEKMVKKRPPFGSSLGVMLSPTSPPLFYIYEDEVSHHMILTMLLEPYLDLYDPPNHFQQKKMKLIRFFKEDQFPRFPPFVWVHMIIYKKRGKKHKKKKSHGATLWSSSFGDKTSQWEGNVVFLNIIFVGK